MREGENPAQIPEKSTGLFHCHLVLTKVEHLWSKIWRHNLDGCKYYNMLLSVSGSSIGNF